MDFTLHVEAGGHVHRHELAAHIARALTALGHGASVVSGGLPGAEPGRHAIVVAPEAYFAAFAREHGAAAARRAAAACVHLVTAPAGSAAFEAAWPFVALGRAVVSPDPTTVGAYRARGVVAARLPLGYVPELAAASDGDRPIDVAFLGTLTPRRERWLAILAARLRGRHVEIIGHEPWGPMAPADERFRFGDEKRAYLARCKVVLHLHAGEQADLPYLRLLDAVHAGAVVVSEPLPDPAPLVAGSQVVEAPADELAEAIEGLLDDPARRARIAAEALAGLRERQPLSEALRPLVPVLAGQVGWHPRGAIVAARARLAGWVGDRRAALRDRLLHVDRSFLPASKAQLDALFVEQRTAWQTLEQRQVLAERNLSRRIAALGVRLAHGAPDAVTTWQSPAWATARPVASVVVTAYNYGRYLEGALDSAFASRDVALEVVVVDDASTDDTARLLQRYAESHPDRPLAVVTHLSNRGLSAARNTGFAHARAPWVFVLDADNEVYPEGIAALLSAAESSDAAFVYPIIERFGGEPGLVSMLAWSVELLVRRNPIDAMALVRKAAWEAVGGYRPDVDAEFGGLEDWALWLAFAERGWRAVHVPRVLARYRSHGSSMIGGTILDYSRVPRLLAKFPGLADVIARAPRPGEGMGGLAPR